MTLLDMHMAGQLNLDDAAPESTSEIIKAARDVDALAGEIRKRATADTRPFEVMLSDSEIMKQAMVLVQADPGLRA
jgi:hypothetical protein